MKNRLPRFRTFAQLAVGISFVSMVLMTSGLVPDALAQTPLPPVLPCGSSPGVINECHTYDELKTQLNDRLQKTWQFSVMTAALNTLQYVHQKLAEDTANWILHGFQGKGTAFYKKTFGDYVKDLTLAGADKFLSEANKFTSAELGFNICKPITLNLKIALGLRVGASRLPPPNCSFQQLGEQYEQAYRGLAPNEIANTLRHTIADGGNDTSIGLHANQAFLNNIIGYQQSGILNRQEGGGLKPITDFLSNQIRSPVQVAKDALTETSVIKIDKENKTATMQANIGNAFLAGFEQIPVMFASTFANTLVSGLLKKAFAALSTTEEDLANANLSNPDAQNSAETGASGPKPVDLSDILAPNLFSNEKQNFLFELSTCPTPRGLWGCAMDSGFVGALQNQTETGGFTVVRAAGLQPGVPGGTVFLHPDWELIPETEAKDNQDAGCYQRAYCATNLAKMRFARIISVGWELAANSPFNKKVNGRYVTLESVIRNFNVCNDKGQLDADHPWCHLIDPSWVLASPEFQCRIKGFGETVTQSTPPIRVQECSDVVSCLAHDDKGNCTGGYGYCLAEKTVWRFGADACDERYVSCRTYKARDKSIALNGANLESTATGPEVSYVRNTVDYGQCNAENVGCQFYSTIRDTSTTTTERWKGTIGADQSINVPRTYFDGTVQTCDASSDGCTKVYAVQQGQPSLNLVHNGSFESTDPKQPTALTGWQENNKYAFAPFQAKSGDSAEFGSQAAVFSGQWFQPVSQTVEIAPLRNYVLSFYTRDNDVSGGNASVGLQLLNSNDQLVTDPPADKQYYRSSNCLTKSQQTVVAAVNPLYDWTKPFLSSQWQRHTCEFVTNADAVKGRIYVNATDAAIDGIQLEEGDNAAAFVDGDNTSLPVDHLKLAPTELACSGNQKTDRAECKNFARVCKQADAGCQAYRDAGGADQTEIPASLNPRDLCPVSCVGYAEYQKLPSAFDLTTVADPKLDYLNDKDDDTRATFVPRAANQCSAAAAGCEEFTNIESVAAGGEQKLYLTYARACLKPNENTHTYFTWEGSDTTGYQLKTWSLIQKTANEFDPVYPVPTTAPRILRKAAPNGVVKDPSGCSPDSWKTGADPDCRQFYDENGTVFYRYFSQTIVSDTACRDYRKNASSLDDCTKTGGDYNQATKECVYHILAAQSNLCAAPNAGCRGYIGTTGRNTASVFQENFAGVSSTAFTSSQAGVSLKISTESLLVGDYSLQVSNPGKLGSADATFPSTTNTLYTVSFWFKTTDPTHKTATINVNGTAVGTYVTEVDWKRYEIGPFRVTNNATSSLISWVNLPDVSYLDTVNVQRLQDTVFVKKDSWIVPPECDQTPEGIPQPQAMLGCRAYVDRNGKPSNVREFSHLCRFENVGCTGYVDTRDSDSAYAQSFPLVGLTKPNPNDPNAKLWDNFYSGTVTVTRPADRFVYLIDEPSAHCDASAASCRAFGKPKLNAYQQLDPKQPFETAYLKDDITQYLDGGGEPKLLCRPSELFCDRYVSGSITSYFRDPQAHVCEWKTGVLLAATSTPNYTYPQGAYSGWFVKGSAPSAPCYPAKMSSGNTFLNEFAGAPGYRGWTSLCPADQSECTEFRDPNDHSDSAHPAGKPYFFITNQKLDKSTCAGKIDLLGGCVLFRDTSDSTLTMSTVATYAASHAQNDSPVAPIDCQNDPTNPACAKAGICRITSQEYCVAPDCKQVTEVPPVFKATAVLPTACSADADCMYEIGDPNVESYTAKGTCEVNNANLILKVKLARDCTTWLGCSTGETVFDPEQQKYVDLCESTAMCDKSLGSTGKNFCAHYVDRGPLAPKPVQGSYEPVMRQGAFFDISTYAGRPVGFGLPDYSSYAMPGHFQIGDFLTRRVAYELLANHPLSRNRFVQDYRLVAATQLYLGTKQANGGADSPPGAGYAQDPYGATGYTDSKYKDLNLCIHKQTGRIGYYVPGEKPARCYFAIDAPKVSETNAQSSTDPRNAQKLADLFEQLAAPQNLQSLTQAFPYAECRAYPDGSSPFPNTYVKEWDFAHDPPKPAAYVNGYRGAPYCEFGEDCSCSYRKVSYNGPTKYFSTYGAPPPSGVCVGGSRDGEACVPDAVAGTPAGSTQDPNDKTKQLLQEATGASSNKLCGTGTCQAIQTVSIVSGLYAQCIQRDASRTIGGSQEHNPCLIWDPSPVLFGRKDIYHYQPTAGYLPPQNSGEYYCVGAAQRSYTVPISADVGDNDGPRAGAFLVAPLSTTGFHFDEDFISDGVCTFCSGNDGTDVGANKHSAQITFMDGKHAKGGTMGTQCEDADDNENGGSFGINTDHAVDPMAGRWISTMRGPDHNYVEYFVGFNGGEWAKSIRPNGGSASDALMERNFAYFSFSPIVNPNGKGYLGCGMTTDWVDGVNIDDYDDDDQLQNGQKQWDAAFRQNFNGRMTRENADYLRSKDGKLLKNDCVFPEDAKGVPDGKCFYKYWQIGYRDQGQTEFLGVEAGAGRFDAQTFSNVGASEASKSFFAIRAMFEDTSTNDNKQPASKPDPSGNTLSGPFRFVGWWITASVPGAADERAIYMALTIGSASVCPQVAQVISPDSRENAAFTDRVTPKSSFSLPLLGFGYSTQNPPFGAAVNTRPIGLEPLFQVHGKIPGTTSKLKPPTFVSSGQEYFQYVGGSKYPTEPWGLLTNLFARVYRVYRYYDRAVGSGSSTCIKGPSQGVACTPNANSSECSLVGTCDPTLVDAEKLSGFCNSLSGVNSGLPCSASNSDPQAGYHVCHNSAMLPDKTGTLHPLFTTCSLDTKNWSQPDSSTLEYYACPSGNCPHYGQKDAIARGAFRCAPDAVTINNSAAKCDPTKLIGGKNGDCPVMVKGDGAYDKSYEQNGNTALLKDKTGIYHSGCITSGPSAGRCAGFEQSQCKYNSQCRFTQEEWWGKYNAEKPWGGKFVRSGTSQNFVRDPLFDNPDEDPADFDELSNGKFTSSANSQYARSSSWFRFNGDGYSKPWDGSCSGFSCYTSYGSDRQQYAANDQYSPSWDALPTSGNSWWQSFQDALFGGHSPEMGYKDNDPASGKDIGGHDLYGGGFVLLPYTGANSDLSGDGTLEAVTIDGKLGFAPAEVDRYPGAFAASVVTQDTGDNDNEAVKSIFIPGHCEKTVSASAFEVTAAVGPVRKGNGDDAQQTQSAVNAANVDHPYAQTSWFCATQETINDKSVDCDFAGYTSLKVSPDEEEWHEYQRWFNGGADPNGSPKPGICVGGSMDGQTCSLTGDANKDKNACRRPDITDEQVADSNTWCVTANPDPSWKNDFSPSTPGSKVTKNDVWNTCHPQGFKGDPNSSNLDLDDNLCTHNAGYLPRADLCGNDLSKSQCLTSYVVKNPVQSVNPDSEGLPPTDVTMGLHTPSFLGAPQQPINFSYIAHYAPMPPKIAAPDTSRSCPAAGQCPISLPNTFSLEHQPEGIVAYTGGQAVANILFYGWAAHDQGALKDMWVDWGDGNRQEIHDASMKNHKPFCDIGRECQFIPGLTCKTDNDCPPAGGKCVNLGSCASRGSVPCLKDSDCQVGGTGTDKCLPRTPFGDTTSACEQNYFDFTHAYACGSEKATDPSFPKCDQGGKGLCSRDTARACSVDGDCVVGQTCLKGKLAPPGGCFDVAKSACRFTPRVLLKDNWGWCTGECRTVKNGSELIYGPIGSEPIPHINGGCYDFSKDVANYDANGDGSLNDAIMVNPNECDPNGFGNLPWIVYQGALQLGVGP